MKIIPNAVGQPARVTVVVYGRCVEWWAESAEEYVKALRAAACRGDPNHHPLPGERTTGLLAFPTGRLRTL
jgi:hypothetical protein